MTTDLDRLLELAEVSGDASAARHGLREAFSRRDAVATERFARVLALLKTLTRSQLEEAALKRLAERSLSVFARAAWHVVEPARRYVHGFHIDAICEHLEAVSRGEIRRLVINIPPRHMKSLLVSVFFQAWEWTTRPSLRYLCASHAGDLATRDSLKCRRVLLSPWYQRHWGALQPPHLRGPVCVQLAGDQNRKTRFENTATGFRLATSVGGGAIGEGGNRISVDDAHKPSEVDSPDALKRVWSWWREEMSSRGDDAAAAFVVVGQRIHSLDLTGRLLDQGGVCHLSLSALYEPKTQVEIKEEETDRPTDSEDERLPVEVRFKDPRRREGQLLWPQRWGRAYLEEQRRRLGSFAFNAQYQQRPRVRGGGIWRLEWFNRWVPGELPEFKRQAISADMSFGSKTRTASYVCFQLWGMTEIGAFYLLDQRRARMTYPEAKKAFKLFCLKHPEALTKYVENKAAGMPLKQDLEQIVPGIVLVEPRKLGGKVDRAIKVSPLIEAGFVYIPDERRFPWVKLWRDEVEAFPASANDDQVDTTSQALAYLEHSGQRRLNFGWLG